MFRVNWNLSNAVRSQIKHIIHRPKFRPAPVSATPYSSLESDNGGFGGDLTIGEQKLITKLKHEFPNATHLQVSDVSGGCGAMYQISIETPEFIGKRRIQQHQMVNKVLAEEIKQMHGLQLSTQEPQAEKK